MLSSSESEEADEEAELEDESEKASPSSPLNLRMGAVKPKASKFTSSPESASDKRQRTPFLQLAASSHPLLTWCLREVRH